MRRILHITILSVYCMFLVSCSLIDFSEDCIYDGNIAIRFNWSYLFEGDKSPGLTDTWVYTGPVRNYSIQGDTLLTGIGEGTHTLLAVGGTRTDGLTEMGDIQTASIKLPVIRKGEKDYTCQASVFYADRRDVPVQAGKTSVCEFTPRSCVQQVILDFVVPGHGVAFEAERVTGDLSGVQTGYSFGNMRAVPSAAYLSYDTEEIKTGIFRSSNIVFGMNPAKDGADPVSNILGVDLRLAGGGSHFLQIDLTRQFDGFLSPIIYITLEIRPGLMGMEIKVTSWETGEDGKIEI